VEGNLRMDAVPKKKLARKSLGGQMRVVETILASFVLLFALFFINTFTPTPSSPAYEVRDLERLGENVLQRLDEEGLLGQWVYNEDWSNLTAALRVLLPSNVYFNLSVFSVEEDENGRPILVDQGALIQYGNPEIFSNSEFVASVTYVLPGYQQIYGPRVLRLQLVRG